MNIPSEQLCGGCREAGYCQLGLGPITVDRQLSASATVKCAELFHAGPRVAHGGWTAALMDDMIGRSLVQMGARVVTAKLTIEFLKPVPVEEDMMITVHVDAHEGRRWTTSAKLRLIGSNDDLARASGLWIERRDDHFERHEQSMTAYREQK